MKPASLRSQKASGKMDGVKWPLANEEAPLFVCSRSEPPVATNRTTVSSKGTHIGGLVALPPDGICSDMLPGPER